MWRFFLCCRNMEEEEEDDFPTFQRYSTASLQPPERSNVHTRSSPRNASRRRKSFSLKNMTLKRLKKSSLSTLEEEDVQETELASEQRPGTSSKDGKDTEKTSRNKTPRPSRGPSRSSVLTVELEEAVVLRRMLQKPYPSGIPEQSPILAMRALSDQRRNPEQIQEDSTHEEHKSMEETELEGEEAPQKKVQKPKPSGTPELKRKPSRRALPGQSRNPGHSQKDAPHQEKESELEAEVELRKKVRNYSYPQQDDGNRARQVMTLSIGKITMEPPADKRSAAFEEIDLSPLQSPRSDTTSEIGKIDWPYM